MNTTSVSVIVCSNSDPSYDLHIRNVGKTIGVPHEYIRVDNRSKTYSLCSAYNRGVEKATGDICVFVHEDVFFMQRGWGETLLKKFNSDESVGCIGVAGGQYVSELRPGWVVGGRPYIFGRVIHEIPDQNRFVLTVYSWSETDTDVVAVDGLFFAIPRCLFGSINFDQQTFHGFHLYDLDICMQIRKTHRVLVTTDIIVKHRSGGSFDKTWEFFAARFLEKYKGKLPVCCAGTMPDLTRVERFESFDVSDKVPHETIA